MSVTCRVAVYNESNGRKFYHLFQDNPQPENGPTGKVFSNVYDCSPELESGSGANVKWTMTNQYYGIYGTIGSIDAANSKVETSAFKKVKLGPNGTVLNVEINSNGDPSFGEETLGSRPDGGFTVQTNSFVFPNKKNTYIGIGGASPSGGSDIIPVQTYLAEPKLRSVMFPRLKYFVATGKYEAGTLVDRSAIGEAVEIDFTGAAIPEVKIRQDNLGNYWDVDNKRQITEIKHKNSNGVTLSLHQPL